MSGKLKLNFYGGTESVTGANFVLSDDDSRIMVDCGLTQGPGIDLKNGISADPNRRPFPYNPKEIDYLIVTHAHADHIGLIPRLVREGFSGQIFSTPTTRQISEIVYDDALTINMAESRKYDLPPLYERRDVEAALSMWETHPYHEEFALETKNERFSVLFKDAGHILGSAIVYIKAKKDSSLNVFDSLDMKDSLNIVFTGDLGNTPTPLIRNTEVINDADFLIMESVYGDRNHEGKDLRQVRLREILRRVIARKGTLLIPVFSLEKTQVLLHEMNELIEDDLIPSVPVFFDSPLGIRLTEVYSAQFKNFNEKVQARIIAGDDIFDFPKLNKTYSAKESAEIRRTPGPKVIIASSGMSSGGRILSHEMEYLPDPKNAILFIGYQVPGTIGRAIEDGTREVKIFGRRVPIHAQVETVSGYSSHKDSDNLVEFVADSVERLKKVFVVMGEPKSAMTLTQKLRDNLGVDAVHPREGECVVLG